MMYGKLTTTKPRAQVVKAYTLSKAAEYAKLSTSLDLKRWLKAEFSTQQYAERVAEKMKTLAKSMAVSIVMTQPRKGDNAPQYEVSILNYDAQKNEQ